MKTIIAGLLLASVLAGCTEPRPVPAQESPNCPALPEPPKTPTSAYLLLVIDMYRLCASR